MVIIVDNYRAQSNVLDIVLSVLYVLIHLVLSDFHKVGVTTISVVSRMRQREAEWQNYTA